MASTPEAKVKKKVTDQLKELGAYYFYAFTGGYGKSGVPDIVGCYRGYFFAIECKAGSNKPTPLQDRNIEEIRRAGGLVVVVNEDNVNEVTTWLKEGVNELLGLREPKD
jgi:Holliday junction resolvase